MPRDVDVDSVYALIALSVVASVVVELVIVVVVDDVAVAEVLKELVVASGVLAEICELVVPRTVVEVVAVKELTAFVELTVITDTCIPEELVFSDIGVAGRAVIEFEELVDI